MGLNAFLFLSCLSLGVVLKIDAFDMSHNSMTQCQATLMQAEVANRLNQYLDMTMAKVLSTFGVFSKLIEVKENSREPLESFLLQTLLSVRQDTMDSLTRIQKDLVNTVTFALRFADCWDILNAGITESGIYEIYPSRSRFSKPVKVFCDMKTDGGGWTVFLLRDKDSKHVNFTRNWEDYKNGFGDPEQEYWLGNEHLHELTSNRNYTLRTEAKDGNDIEVWGQWNAFSVDSEQNKYKLTSTKMDPMSTVGDVFYYHNNMFFSTFDMDNDKDKDLNAAERWKGGWWYNAFYHINPTGDHTKDCEEGLCLLWWSFSDTTKRTAVWIQLKIRPSQ